jgi:amino acid transporter
MNLLQTFNLIFFVCGFFVWLIVPIARTQKYTTAKEVFTGDHNFSGWSNFVAFMIGLAGVSAGYGIPDSVTHIAEETRRPATDLPKIMILTPLIALLTGTAMVLTFLFCGVPSIVMALNQTGVPYLDFLDQTVRNRTGATIMSVILIYIQFVACLQAQLAVSHHIPFGSNLTSVVAHHLHLRTRGWRLPSEIVRLNRLDFEY